MNKNDKYSKIEDLKACEDTTDYNRNKDARKYSINIIKDEQNDQENSYKNFDNRPISLSMEVERLFPSFETDIDTDVHSDNDTIKKTKKKSKRNKEYYKRFKLAYRDKNGKRQYVDYISLLRDERIRNEVLSTCDVEEKHNFDYILNLTDQVQ